MRCEYREQFMDSTRKVFGCVIRSNVTRRQESSCQGDPLREDVAIAVRLVGNPGGLVLLQMNTATAINICARLNETDFSSLTPFAVDTLSELANMIAGHTASFLNNQGFDFTLSTPHFGIRENSAGNTHELEGFQIPLMTDCGDVTIQVALKAH